MISETTTTGGGFLGDPTEAFTPPATVGCCGGSPAATADSATASGGSCCGTAVEAAGSGGCCGGTAEAQAGTSAAGCCG